MTQTAVVVATRESFWSGFRRSFHGLWYFRLCCMHNPIHQCNAAFPLQMLLCILKTLTWCRGCRHCTEQRYTITIFLSRPGLDWVQRLYKPGPLHNHSRKFMKLKVKVLRFKEMLLFYFIRVCCRVAAMQKWANADLQSYAQSFFLIIVIYLFRILKSDRFDT